MFQFKKLKAFTLLELLIVIAIIGILAAALLPTITGAPKKARDAQRKAMVSNIVKAAETVGGETSKYPDNAVAGTGDCLKDSAVPGSTLAGQISNFPNKGPGANPPKNLCGAAGFENAYFYKKLSDAYVVASEVENCSSGNVTKAGPSAVAALTAAAAAGDITLADGADGGTACVYAIVQKF